MSAVAELRTAGLDNFNLDLMYALPGQTPDDALADLEQALHRSLTQFDLDFAVWQVAGWFGAILDLGVEAARGMHDELARVLIGMKAMAALRL